MAGRAACGGAGALRGAPLDIKLLQRMPLARACARPSSGVYAVFSMMQESACFIGKCTFAVQFAAASITSVFRKQSVV